MVTSSRLLDCWVRGLLRVSKARSASLFVPARPGLRTPVLIHAGEMPPVPELADVTAAAALDARPVMRADVSSPETAIVPSVDPDALLIPLLSMEEAPPSADTGQMNGRRRRDMEPEDPVLKPVGWLALRMSPGDGSPLERLRASWPAEVPPGSLGGGVWAWATALGGGLAEHAAEVSALLADPVSGLPGRSAFILLLEQAFRECVEQKDALGLLAVNPDAFMLVNERFGRQAADEVVRELVRRIRMALRLSDLLVRFGGVTFSVILPGAGLAESGRIAEKIVRSAREATFLGGALRLGVSIGVAAYEPGPGAAASSADLIRRSDQALSSAKNQGGDRIAVWELGSGTERAESFDRLTGIFTGRMSVDYRNMALLWDAMNMMARLDDAETLAAQLVTKIDGAFAPRRVLFLIRTPEGVPRVVHCVSRRSETNGLLEVADSYEIPAEMSDLVRRAWEESRPVDTWPAGHEATGKTHLLAVPLLSRGEPLGALVLERVAPFDIADVTFLGGMGRQVGSALERLRLAGEAKRREAHERRRLERELEESRQSADRVHLEYKSPEMQLLLSRALQVAPTEATVLVMGESGTGKELLARTIHDLSPRRQKPLVVVDCSAIAATLIDSELFGAEAGAFTGAQQRRPGRLAEADGGTVLLDEIGELPLDVQGKLLRFVQEKQLTAVGGTRARAVNVRIIAATNRDLASESAAGSFRQDLYHRLNVVSFRIPTLRERPVDVLHLANYFLARCSVLYHKEVRGLTAAAVDALLGHSWPGNVRELENRIMQAVILCSRNELDAADLGLAGSEARPVFPGAPAPLPPDDAEAAESESALWEKLRAELGALVDAATREPARGATPLGRWLAADLIAETAAAAEGGVRRGAALMGIPEATFRHRLQKARTEAAYGSPPRPAFWDAVRRVLRAIARRPNPAAQDRLEHAQHILLTQIMERISGDEILGARLLGVTPQTWRRRRAVVSQT